MLYLKFLHFYVVVSIILFIFLNLGKREGGLSAYSVFNKNFQKLAGESDANEIANNLLYRPPTNNNENINSDDELNDDIPTHESKQTKSISKLNNLPCKCGSGRKYKRCCNFAD